MPAMTDQTPSGDQPAPPARRGSHFSRRADPAPSVTEANAPLATDEAAPPATDDAAAPAVEEPAARGGRDRAEAATARRPRRWPVVALGALSVVLAAALVVTLLDLRSRDQVNSARTSALAAARTYSVELSSYRYTELQKDFELVLSHSTPAFQKNYTKSSSALNKILVQYKASATGSVKAAGVVSATTKQVVVLVDVDQKVTNSTKKTPTQDESRLQMTLVRENGRWLIDKLTLL